MSDIGNCEVCGEPVKGREETRGVDQWQVVCETIYRHRKTAECLVANKALRDTITALRAEAESLTEKLRRSQVVNVALGHHEMDAVNLRSQLSARDAEVRALREDAARYRWLRKAGFNIPDLPYKRQSFAKSVAEIEAAIDRCRSDGEDDNG